jgi:SAM-dependent methyltransferase
MKLHLGCGQRLLAGYINVDKEGSPDVRHDLEEFPWPWPDNEFDEVLLHHTLEHLGRTPKLFLGVMRELYRVCAPGAAVHITVPHPRHDHFIGDPTHVRAITPEVLSLFSKKNCEAWKQAGASNTPLAVFHNIDFEVERKSIVLEPKYLEGLRSGAYTALQIDEFLRDRNNIATEMKFTLRAIKAAA